MSQRYRRKMKAAERKLNKEKLPTRKCLEDSVHTHTCTSGLPDCVTVSCLQRGRISINEGSVQFLSTLKLRCSSRSGRLGAAICGCLRRLGLPVVGDRFASKESATLPRCCRSAGLGKSKLLLGCFGLHVSDAGPIPETSIDLELPQRFCALHWEAVAQGAEAGAA